MHCLGNNKLQYNVCSMTSFVIILNYISTLYILRSESAGKGYHWVMGEARTVVLYILQYC